ncbi:MAG: hypothetical protein R3272_14845, partial [Candidatus Promineifilaceae bacterium]|nr:hypothetical protein [Candidatus Promineifilaceae bacterium]
HAPIIIPAVLRVEIPYRPLFYAHLLLLHLSLATRIAGDLLLEPALRRWGGLFNALAILLFLVVTLAPWSRVARLVLPSRLAAGQTGKVPG